MSTRQSQPLTGETEQKIVPKEYKLMFDVKYLLDNNIMEQSEFDIVIERRNLFLEKTNNNDVNREDYMAQIHEELKLLDVYKLNNHDSSQSTGTQSNYIKAIGILVGNIDNMYSSMLRITPINLSSLENYMNFRYSNKEFINDETNLLHQVMTAKHIDSRVYTAAALFEYFKMNDVASARLCFSEGLKFHKNCKVLLSEDFNFEVHRIEDTNGESLPIALSKYEYIAKCFKGDLEFHFTLLDLVLRFNSVWELQYRVISDMFEEYKQDEKMWQKLAMVNLSGFIFDYGLKRLQYDQHCLRRLSYSIKVFDDGLKEDWSPEKRKILWNMFIDHMIEIWKENGVKNETISSYVHGNMERLFRGALNEECLHKAEHYAYWALYNNEDRHEILSTAIEMNTNINIWIEILTVYIEAKSFEMIKKVFECALEALKQESMPLWKLVEEYIIDNNLILALYDFYKKAVHGPYPLISLMFRSSYLLWYGQSFGLTSARKVFHELITMSPPCKQLYLDMIYYEQETDFYNITQVRKLYKEVCYTLGHGDVELWANYINFEYTHDQSTAENIYKSSLEYLGSELFSVLTEQFENIKHQYNERVAPIIDSDIMYVDEAEI